MSTKSFLEEREFSLEEYVRGKPLTSEHCQMIQNDDNSLWAVAYVWNIRRPSLAALGESFIPLAHPHIDQHYINHLTSWIDRTEYFLGQRLGRHPASGEVQIDLIQQHETAKFTLWYSLIHSEHMCLDEQSFHSQPQLVETFLLRAEQIAGKKYISFFLKDFNLSLEAA